MDAAEALAGSMRLDISGMFRQLLERAITAESSDETKQRQSKAKRSRRNGTAESSDDSTNAPPREPWQSDPSFKAWEFEWLRRQARQAEEHEHGAAKRSPFAPNADLDILGIESWPCTIDDVRRAQRQAAGLHHPDRGGDSRVMQRINAAAEAVLKIIHEGPTVGFRWPGA